MDHPESLASIVFVRTAKGANACKTNSQDLPRPLKRLLLVVDGRSTVSKFIPYLTNLLPLSEKFAELESLGFIQKSQTVGHRSNGLDEAVSFLSTIEELPIDLAYADQALLTSALGEIENFLTGSVGPKALPIMSGLKKITTIEHLKETLPDYFDLIESYDIDASHHALNLENLFLSK